MKRLNRILSLALAAMMALTLLTGCGGKVTERAMEKAYGDYLRGQEGKPDMKVTYDVSPAVFEKIDADFRANKATTIAAAISATTESAAVPSVLALPC